VITASWFCAIYLPNQAPNSQIQPRFRLAGNTRMNWIGLFAAMAVVAIIFSVVTDVEMTECQRGSVYAIVHFCKPDKPPNRPFDCRFDPDRCE
jgi:hypothetical protein